MSILSAQSIRELKPIEPFHERRTHLGMTYGLSACGYDIRIAEDFIMWPLRFVLASSLERFKIPDNVCARVLDKSTWARRGICVQNTFIEPGWEGYLTLEITNHRWQCTKLLRGMPIAQIVFEQLDKPTEQPYSGKYQNQRRGAQPARLLDIK